MGKTLQEQLAALNALFKTIDPEEATNHKESTTPQVRRWVVWRKDGKDYRKVCVVDTQGDGVGRVVNL